MANAESSLALIYLVRLKSVAILNWLDTLILLARIRLALADRLADDSNKLSLLRIARTVMLGVNALVIDTDVFLITPTAAVIVAVLVNAAAASAV